MTASKKNVPFSPFATSDAGSHHPAELPAQFRPTFVVGCERSGTTLLAVMIGRHTSIAMTPETHFFLRVVPKRIRQEVSSHAQLVQEFYNSPRVEDLGLERNAILERLLGKPATYASLFETLLTLYAERWGKPFAGEKTPFHLMRVPLILEWFPQARIVGIVRDGRDVVRSIMNAPWTAHRSLRRQCWKWAESAELSRRLAREYPHNFFLIRYEDLVRAPEETLRQVDAFLGIPFESGQLESGAPSPAVPDREWEWKARAILRPDASRIGTWEKAATTRELLIMNSLMGPDLRACGYGNTELPAVSAWGRFVNGTKNELCKIGLYRLWGNILRYTSPERRRKRATDREEIAVSTSDSDESSEVGATIEAAV